MNENKQPDIIEEVRTENEKSSESNEQSFEFITETIKARPVNKKRIIYRTVFTFVLAIIFGVVASLTFVLLMPKFQEHFYPVEDTKPVTLSQTEEDESPLFEDGASVDEVKKDTDEILDDVSQKEDISGEEIDKTEEIPGDQLEEKKEEPQIINQVVERIEKDLELEDYSKLYQQMGDVANEAKRAIVKVTGLSSDTDWFRNKYESKHTTAGLIIADNGKELLILARTSAIIDADSFDVTFCDGTKLDATIKKSDANTDLSIIAVNLEDISDSTKDKIKMAELGNSKRQNLDGTPIIAVGDPLGVDDSMAIGQITSHTTVKDMVDANAAVITTDIYGSSSASGIIINLSGKVLGIITMDTATTDAKNLIKAYSISDLKDKIEKISNGQEIAYLGIIGMDVTDEAVENYGVPKGAYIRQVVIDSPAMEAGIQNGDVIVKLGTTDITSFTDYKDVMLKCQPEDLLMVTVKRMGRNEYVELSYEITLGKLSE